MRGKDNKRERKEKERERERGGGGGKTESEREGKRECKGEIRRVKNKMSERKKE